MVGITCLVFFIGTEHHLAFRRHTTERRYQRYTPLVILYIGFIYIKGVFLPLSSNVYILDINQTNTRYKGGRAIFIEAIYEHSICL